MMGFASKSGEPPIPDYFVKVLRDLADEAGRGEVTAIALYARSPKGLHCYGHNAQGFAPTLTIPAQLGWPDRLRVLWWLLARGEAEIQTTRLEYRS